MSHSSSSLNEGLLDLLADAIASGYEPESVQSSEQPGVRGQFTDAVVQDFEQAAAAVACACALGDAEQLPESLRLRCSGAGRVVASGAGFPAPVPSRPGPLRFVQHEPSKRDTTTRGAPLGWLAAAACLVIAAAAWWPNRDAGPLSPEQKMASLVASANDLTSWDWAPWDSEFGEVTGEVVWSEAAQEGYLVLTGMPVNDPDSAQYQLWVVESSRGTPLEVPPVDGGVFDITTSGEAVIAITCAIPARDVVAFAVTIEPPGGVVVSDQSQKAVIAQAPAPVQG